MELIHFLIDFILHIDDHLGEIIQNYGLWIYAIIFLIVFCETGLVVTPFLPGDSLLFATGAIIAAQPEAGLSFWVMYWVIFVAAVIGDTTNYHIGKYIGEGVFKRESKYIKKEYLDKTRAFYEKHGGKAIVYARFVPIIRTFAPFVAGVGTMDYKRFVFYNVFGAFLWVTLFLGAGFLFGNLEFIKNNFSMVILTIILVSLMPIVIEYIKARRQS
ncbi:MAG: DedA family protein [Bacteroidota bacterium]